MLLYVVESVGATHDNSPFLKLFNSMYSLRIFLALILSMDVPGNDTVAQ